MKLSWHIRATRLQVIKGHQTWYIRRFDMLCMVSYQRAIVTLSLISNVFWDIRLQKMSWPWNPSQKSLNAIGTNTDQSPTYDFLVTLHSNHEPLSYRFRDKPQFLSKIANFPTPVYLTPLLMGSLGIEYRCNGSKNQYDGLPDGQNSFKIGLAV